jgi:hypothetical protein
MHPTTSRPAASPHHNCDLTSRAAGSRPVRPRARHRMIGLLAVAATTTVAACGDSKPAAKAEQTAPVATAPITEPTNIAPAATTVAAAPTTVAAPATTPVAWREDVAAFCDALFEGLAAVPPNDGSATDLVRFVADLQAGASQLPPFDAIRAPADTQPAIDQVAALLDNAAMLTSRAGEAAAAGDALGAADDLSGAQDAVRRSRGLLALAGAPCDTADPARAQSGALNVPTEGNTFMINAGFGSIWASQNLLGHVTRHDPVTGAVIATIDVGAGPQKLQPADGRMWVRTADRYVAIDPATNTIVATLDKSAVGPNADRSFARDGAMWICDGRQLHRYDPTSLQPVATVDLDVDCEEVYATDDLVVAYRTNQDDGQSGTAAAAFIDPTDNHVLATVALPVDVAYPAVLDDAVFFPGESGTTAVVVDRNTWAITGTPDLGRSTRVGLTATDGERIYVPATGYRDVVVVDAGTYNVIETIETLGNASPVLLDGSLWTADSWDGLMQRHDDLG